MAAGYPRAHDDERIFGRGPHDAEMLFPRYTCAEAATTGEVIVNGKALKLWTFQQLEALHIRVLKERALTIRDAVGEDNCPQIPAGHASEFIRWILNMQAKLTESELQPSRHGVKGTAPSHFLQEQSDTHQTFSRGGKAAPFGLRPVGSRANHDNYYDLKMQRGEFEEAPVQGIQSLRPGGEGRKHIDHGSNMLTYGVSAASPEGITAMRPRGVGRRHLHCDDHMWPEPEGSHAGSAIARGERSARTSLGHVCDSSMTHLGVAEPPAEPHVGGTRRRHYDRRDHMMGPVNEVHGAAKPHYANAPSGTGGRRKMDGFKGGDQSHTDSQAGYTSTWKKNPSRLRGTSLLC